MKGVRPSGYISPSASNGSSVISALQEQLGLNSICNEPLDVLVIDHAEERIEQPPPNLLVIMVGPRRSWIRGRISHRPSPMTVQHAPVFCHPWCNLVQSLGWLSLGGRPVALDL